MAKEKDIRGSVGGWGGSFLFPPSVPSLPHPICCSSPFSSPVTSFTGYGIILVVGKLLLSILDLRSCLSMEGRLGLFPFSPGGTGHPVASYSVK